jgi:alkylhydroperoxidase family enzyme
MAHIRQIEPADATGELKRLYDSATLRAGSVANIIRLMSLDAKIATASMQFYVALMKSPGSLEKALREMLATVVSNVNDCYY